GPERSRQGLTATLVLLMIWSTVVFTAWLVGPFLAAGRVNWVNGWIYFVVVAGGLATHRSYLKRRSPALLQQRRRIGAGTKPWDIVWVIAFWPLMAAVPIVAGFGVRLGWSSLPTWLWPIGLLIFASGLVLSAWAMLENPHFEGTVRIQYERDHRVVDTGPYGHVRHPGYVGLGLWALATPLLLLSWAAIVPAGVVTLWLILRTALEDGTLRRELGGYVEYSQRVRYRLVPGIW
ncbi:MAG TPA: isoprenylcysteine carboxylmethyltransferase family protein, partial [Polyangiaceae bacterium]